MKRTAVFQTSTERRSGVRLDVVDHINCNGLDNRRANLRVCTVQQNLMNCERVQRKRATPYKGVSLGKDGKYYPRLMVKGKMLNMGSFATAEEAARVYDEAALRHCGEFAYLNFPAKKMQSIDFAPSEKSVTH